MPKIAVLFIATQTINTPNISDSLYKNDIIYSIIAGKPTFSSKNTMQRS